MSQSLIARIERGDVNPRISTLKRILAVLEEAMKTKDTAENVMTSPVITVSPDDSVTTAIAIMDRYGISQLPVVDKDGHVIGTVLESTILKAVFNRGVKLKIRDVMEPPLPMVSPSTSIDVVVKLLEEYPAVLVVDRGELKGIITKIDIIRYRISKQ